MCVFVCVCIYVCLPSKTHPVVVYHGFDLVGEIRVTHHIHLSESHKQPIYGCDRITVV